jgi:hypothetical protein
MAGLLKFRDPRFERRNLGRLRRHQRNQLFPRRLAVRIRIRIHRILESKRDSAVEKKLRAQGSNGLYYPSLALSTDLGSYNKTDAHVVDSVPSRRQTPANGAADKP